MRHLVIKAPAKVNLHLRIKARRPDGFHSLESIFLALDFGDTLRFDPLERENVLELIMKEGCNIKGEVSPSLQPPAASSASPSPKGAKCPLKNPLWPALEDNIIFKAIARFRQQTGFLRGLRVTVEKNIPLGGGLGGGSSDAAAALLAMNELSGSAGGSVLDTAALMDIAASLGSDVPFFFYPSGLAWVSGRGELVRPIPPLGELWLVLVNPGFSSNTAAAYRLLDETRSNSSSNDMAKKSVPRLAKPALLRFLREDPSTWPFENDFLPVFMAADAADSGHAAAYREILSQLSEAGAGFACLSGSGATCFGVFSDKMRAQKAADFFSSKWPFIKITFPLRLK